MRDRCTNIRCPNYRNYGGRGIFVCTEWIDDPAEFISWLIENGWEKGLEIDRIDNDEGYYPENCRIVTRQQNQCNTRIATKKMAGIRKHHNRYTARFTRFGREYHVGSFITIDEAIEARAKAISELMKNIKEELINE